jgi:hypothetical protein
MTPAGPVRTTTSRNIMGEQWALAVTCRLREQLHRESSAIHVHVFVPPGGVDIRLAEVAGVQAFWRGQGRELDAVVSVAGLLGIRCAVQQAFPDWHRFPLSLSCDATISAEVRRVFPEGPIVLEFDDAGIATRAESVSFWKRTLNLISSVRKKVQDETLQKTDLGLD